ncbi:MAG: class I SAM-dependent methyltransferase [Actinomycetes bacterium]
MKPPLTPMARLRYDRIRALLPLGPRSLLEIGCGEGAVGYRLAQQYSYVGVEPDEQSCAVARARVGARGDVRCADIATLTGERFDIVCAFEVLEHIEDDESALRAWCGLLDPGGHLLISVPAYADRFGAADEAVGHFRRYEPAAVAKLLESVGLTDVRMLMYGAPLGYALESVRNRLLATRSSDASRADRTAASGRLLQPRNPVVATMTAVAVAPFALVQRALPHHGVGIVARGQLPPQTAAGATPIRGADPRRR